MINIANTPQQSRGKETMSISSILTNNGTAAPDVTDNALVLAPPSRSSRSSQRPRRTVLLDPPKAAILALGAASSLRVVGARQVIR